MRNKVVLVVLATVASAALVVLAVILVLGGEPSFSDPAGAQCNAPPVTFGPTAVFPDHQEAEVHFTCAGAVLAGTVYLPTGVGPHPAVVWVHAAGKSRPTYGGPIVSAFLHSGLAIFSYDKRGVGRSQGQCCPGDYGHFNLFTADVVGAVTALRTRSDIDPKRIGLIGASQAGWVAPRAAVESHAANRAARSFFAPFLAPTVPSPRWLSMVVRVLPAACA